MLVTSLDNDVVSIIDHYRHRASCENNFDEIKNHWVGVAMLPKILNDAVSRLDGGINLRLVDALCST